MEDEQKSRVCTEDEADASVLDDVRLALDRVADGSYGRCLVDEQRIDEKRLEAILDTIPVQFIDIATRRYEMSRSIAATSSKSSSGDRLAHVTRAIPRRSQSIFSNAVR